MCNVVRAAQGLADNRYHNNGDGTFTDISKKTGVDDPERRYGLTTIWSDFDNDGSWISSLPTTARRTIFIRMTARGISKTCADVSVAANEDGFEQANMGVAIGDYLHTGRVALLLSHFDIEYAALTAQGGMNFTDSSIVSGVAGHPRYVGWETAFVDFSNGAGRTFFLVNGHVYPQVDSAHKSTRYLEPKLLFLNQHDGTFRNISKQVGPAIQTEQVSRGLAMATSSTTERWSGSWKSGRSADDSASGRRSAELLDQFSARRSEVQSPCLERTVRTIAGDLVQLARFSAAKLPVAARFCAYTLTGQPWPC